MGCFHAVLGLLFLAKLSLSESNNFDDNTFDSPMGSYSPVTTAQAIKSALGFNPKEAANAAKAASRSNLENAFDIGSKIAGTPKETMKGWMDMAQDAWETRKEQTKSLQHEEDQEPAPKYVPVEEKPELGFLQSVASSLQAFFASIGMMIAHFFKSIGETLTAFATGQQGVTDAILPQEADRRPQTVEVVKEINYPMPKEQSTKEQKESGHVISDLPNDETVAGSKGQRWSDTLDTVLGSVSAIIAGKAAEGAEAHSGIAKNFQNAWANQQPKIREGAQAAGAKAADAAGEGFGGAAQGLINSAVRYGDGMQAGAKGLGGVYEVITGKQDDWHPWDHSKGHLNGIKPLAGLGHGFLESRKVSLQQNPQKLASIHLRRES
eukprot:gnl/MRDRNA2_/MRDRNA2_92485_c0_seq1.p1 gnl/MRDRNA2_/MRDRNA2_92485_c0~~gnl/MRDRNA2_/MRDRNA2_92485_c0_seq1.p1  ORF type:complete len:379 (+),score=87.32 gnl/MRDRNA2_/MRDRNA2_92485_c0_seq1:96-1232(+)